MTLRANIAMPNLQRCPWNLNMIKTVEDNVVFLTQSLFLLISPLFLISMNSACYFCRKTTKKINMDIWFIPDLYCIWASWIPVNHLDSTNMVVRYQPTNELNWFANHRKYLLDPPRLGKAWGNYRSGIGTGIGTVLPIPGGGLGGPQWGLLQIPFPYDSLL